MLNKSASKRDKVHEPSRSTTPRRVRHNILDMLCSGRSASLSGVYGKAAEEASGRLEEMGVVGEIVAFSCISWDKMLSSTSSASL